MSKMNGGFRFFHGPQVSFEAPQNFVESVDRSFGPKCVPKCVMQGKEVSQQPQSLLNKTGNWLFFQRKLGCRWKIEWEIVHIVQAAPTSSSTENPVPIGQ